LLFGDYFGRSIVVREPHAVLAELKSEWHGVGAFILHGLTGAPFWLAIAGIATAWYCYLINPALSDRLKKMAGGVYTLLDNKYYFDKFNDWFFAGGARELGDVAANVGDRRVIDGFFVNGAARVVGWGAGLMRRIQTGYVYHYAFTMIIGVVALLTWWAVS
jgi:NADH-quinone oxidoreductase subunit L